MRFNSITSLKFFLLYLFTLFTDLQAYTPVNHFTISCGTIGTSYDGERTWTGDTGSMILSHQEGTVSANATTPQSNTTLQVPYTTGRLSRSQFNYSFPVTPGSNFLRLFFYPASYPSFPSTRASFTVHCNQFTLLNDFNFDAEDKKPIFREYVINVYNGERLNLSFTPSQPNSYAFINGIEVFSMPSNLYYMSAHDAGFKLVGTDTLYYVRTNTALQTEYRLKVGGQGISPRNDTGLFRNWADLDEHYLIKQENPNNNDLVGDVDVADGKMNITVNPDYVAPKELYRTARTTKRSLKLTWEFAVDPGFSYLLRLHFCELDPNITKIGDRVFFIYIGSDLVGDRADVMRWSQQQKGLAVQKNYVVLIPKNDTQKKVSLSLQLHPYENSSNPFLNGLEIFKISDSNNLARPNAQNGITVEKRRSRKLIIIIAGVVSGVLFLSLVCFFVVSWARSKFGPHFSTHGPSTNAKFYRNYQWPFDLLCQRFSLIEIKAATNNFDDACVVGIGGFGHVYKGFINDISIPVSIKQLKPGSEQGFINGNSIPVAIKRLKPGSKQGAEEFVNEIEMLSQLRHRNLVPLIGYCNNEKEMILVYNFMARGNLRDHLYNSDKPPLPWKRRLQICIDAAHGLHYLHRCAKTYTIIHSDVKTTNILLDEEWVAKVSDFGLSRIEPTGGSEAHICTTAVKGSFGYIDPEYYKRQHLTEKSDVYSFGVVLFEVLCARPPLIHTPEPRQESLGNWVRYCYKNGTMAQILDPTLKGKIAPKCFRMFCDIGVSCLSEVGTQRPSMNDIVSNLMFALQLQESAENEERRN
ncbi:unnamed protein product [Sphenostylis stenocarpa]|uniref:Protein kinase domain-containing protein n=1 Tax=Sphenostylis stenocarpa TaxID=92480 RepID=A0AA86SN84_9FABA|nr:unnamed protein product [Sphenostylis stenocarpa]